MDDINKIWSFVQEKFKNQLHSVSYGAWIETTKPIRLDHNKLYLEVPQELHKSYWEKNLITNAARYIFELTGSEIIPIIVIAEEANHQVESTNPKEVDRIRAYKASQLNSKYVFDNFVIGKGNQMAHAAALAVSEYPGTTYNPLFFYGGVGLGKTHLMHAIGNHMRVLKPNKIVKYVTSETFTNDFINSLQNNKQEEFRQEYRNVDLLLVDDIQFFGNKEAIQGEFFHTFNELYNNQKQIVLTSDRLPNEIPKLEERLVSRFNWGLSVDITPPDLETRIAILRNKADSEHLYIPNDALSYIAGQIHSNIRELEGALVRVQAFATMSGQEITTSVAAEALKHILPDEAKRQVSISEIQRTVAKHYKLTVDDLKGKKRVREIVVPRQIAMYLCRELTNASFPKIGSEFGNKDHTTVLHSYDKISNDIKINGDLKKEVDNLKKLLS